MYPAAGDPDTELVAALATATELLERIAERVDERGRPTLGAGTLAADLHHALAQSRRLAAKLAGPRLDCPNQVGWPTPTPPRGDLRHGLQHVGRGWPAGEISVNGQPAHAEPPTSPVGLQLRPSLQDADEPNGAAATSADPTTAEPPLDHDTLIDSLPLYDWQLSALDAWQRAGSIGMIEAVTGAGKTRVGLAAIALAVSSGRPAIVAVPTRVLRQQWYRVLRESFPTVRIGTDPRQQTGWDVLVTTVHAAAAHVHPAKERGALLIADECHRFGAPMFSGALRPSYAWRLGLSATVVRDDDGDAILREFFGRVVFSLNYERALAEKVIAPFEFALVAVDLSPDERDQYEIADERARKHRQTLVNTFKVRDESTAQFLRDVQSLADGHGEARRTARGFLHAFGERRGILAATQAKHEVLVNISDEIRASRGTLVFTQTRESADLAAQMLREHGCAAESVHGETDEEVREEHLVALGSGNLSALSAPRILDEGVDVPEVELGIVIARSRTRRQSIQRLGRVVRRKPDDRSARFVVLYAQGTIEDPTLYGIEASEFAELMPSARQVITVDLAEGGLEDLKDFLAPDRPRAPDTAAVCQESANEHTPDTLASFRPRDETATRDLDRYGVLPEPPYTPAYDVRALSRTVNRAPTLWAADLFAKEAWQFEIPDQDEAARLADLIQRGLSATRQLQLSPGLPEYATRVLRDAAAAGLRARNDLVCGNLRLVRHLARWYTRRGLEYDDLIQNGILGLIRAAEKFDADVAKFSTYAAWWIRQSITRAIADEGRAIRIPVHFHEIASQVNRERNAADLTWQQVIRDPSLLETTYSPSQLRSFQLASEPVPGLDDVPGIGDLPSADRSIDDLVEHMADDKLVAYLTRDLSERERLVIRLRFGFDTDEPHTLEEIGHRLGVTRERVRQIESKALKKMHDLATLPAGTTSNRRRARATTTSPIVVGTRHADGIDDMKAEERVEYPA